MAMLRRRACAVLVAALTAATIPLFAQLGAPPVGTRIELTEGLAGR